MSVWNLEEVVTFLHDLQAHFRLHKILYSVGLTGSVLYGPTRSSEKGLDIVVYPKDSTSARENHLRSSLVDFGMNILFANYIVKDRWRRLGSRDNKHVEVWELCGKRVDIFFLS